MLTVSLSQFIMRLSLTQINVVTVVVISVVINVVTAVKIHLSTGKLLIKLLK